MRTGRGVVADSVSVVIPTRDRPELLGQTLASVLAQRGVDVEVLVAEDGRCAATAELVAAVGDRRVRLLTTDRPGGPGAARNRGLASASGRWVAFVDDDDLWAPDKLALQVAAGESTGCGWVYCGAVNVTERGGRLEIISGGPPPSPDRVRSGMPYRNTIGGGPATVLIRRALLARVGGFDPQLPHKEDWDLYVRLALDGPPAVVAQPLVAYRLHRWQRSNRVAGTIAAARTIEERYGGRRSGPIDWPGIYRYLAWHCLRSGLRRQGVAAYLGAARHGDLRSLRRAALALVYPARGAQTGRARPVDPSWRAAAEAWLRALPVPHPLAGGGGLQRVT